MTKPLGEGVFRNLHFLKTIAKSKSSRKRIRLLRNANTDQLVTIVEAALNILKNRFPLNTRQKDRLLPHAPIVRKISRARSEKGARRLVVQNGGNFAFLASLLGPILLEAARNIISGK